MGALSSPAAKLGHAAITGRARHARTRADRAALAGAVLLLGLLAAGCTQQMAEQPRLDPLEADPLTGVLAPPRHPPPGTVSRGSSFRPTGDWDPSFETGRRDGELLDRLPERLLEQQSLADVLHRGRERFHIYCVHCHDATGSGDGIVPQRGYPYPPTWHSARLRSAPIGHFFDVMTRGAGRMPPHQNLIPAADRWAISAYIRALQLSQYAPVDALDESHRRQLPPKESTAADAPAQRAPNHPQNDRNHPNGDTTP